MNKIFKWLSIFIIVLALAGGATYLFKDRLFPEPPKDINIVALGDSLTYGVGSSEANDYVTRLKTRLERLETIDEVTTSNFGVTGNTSTQIHRRLVEQKDIQQAVKKADIVTITAGGNDLMAVVRLTMLRTNASSFEAALTTYKKEMKVILDTIHKENNKAKVYVFGIYNPFTQILGDNEEADEILTTWNNALASITKKEHAEFVPIASEFHKAGATFISPKDQFHPNDEGYALMAKKLYDKIEDK